MAEDTPPSVLRERLRKTKEINTYLEHELTELCEFTMQEKQLLLVEKGCSELGEKNLQLQSELDNLTKTIQSRDVLLNGVKNRVQEQQIRFSKVKNGSSEAAISPSVLVDEVLSLFGDLSKYIENDFTPDEDRNESFSRAVQRLNITGEEVQNEVSKLRQILDTNVQEGARRLSDSLLIREQLNSRTSLFGSKEIAIQTDAEGQDGPVTCVDVANLLDISNVVDLNNVDSGRAYPSNVKELKRKLLEIGEQCQVLSSANEDLEKLLRYKEDEIEKLTVRLHSPCSCRRSVNQDVEYEDETSTSHIQPVFESYLANSSSINYSTLPTIHESKESSFDGSFDENNVPDLTTPYVMRDCIDPSSQQGDGAVIENYRADVAELQKFRTLLTDELEYCLAELDARDEHITLLQNTLPVAHNLCAGIAASSDLFKQCNEEIESLETLIDEQKCNASKEVNAEVTGRLVNVLNVIQKGIDTFGTVSTYPLSDSRADSSFAMSLPSIANESSYPQQFCSILLESTANGTVNDSILSSPNVSSRKLDEILKDSRNLRQSIEAVISDLTREFFNVISKLERVEAIILCFCNMNADNPAKDSRNYLKPLTSYKSVLIEDIGEKARLILDLQKSRSDAHRNSSQVSAQSSNESLIKSDGRHGFGTGSAISNTNSSVYLTAVDSDESNLHFMCQTVNKRGLISSDGLMSTTSGASDWSEDNPGGTDGLTPGEESDGLDLSQLAEATLAAFWKTVNDFNELLQKRESSKKVTLPNDETLTLKKVESYAECVKEVLNGALLCEPMIPTYDPDCTKLMALDITALNEDVRRKKPLRTSLVPVNQNIMREVQEEKENSFRDHGVTLTKAVENWEKLIHDSNKRIDELVQSKSNIEVKLSEKIADNNNLIKQLDEARFEVKSYQENLEEKNGLIETLNSLIANKDTQLDIIKSEITHVQHEASQLRSELNGTKENSSLMITDFKAQFRSLSENIDSFRAEIGNLRKEKQQLEVELSSASVAIEGLKTDLLNKEGLETSLEVAEERLSKEVVEKEELRKNLNDVNEKLITVVMKVSDLEREVSSLNDNLVGYNKLRASNQMVEERLAIELADKEELQKTFKNITEQLSVAENQVCELEVVKKTLDVTRENWNTLIMSSSAQIDQLKTSLKFVDVQLAQALSERMELKNDLHDAKLKLSAHEKRICDLETELATVNETLLGRINLIQDLEEAAKLSSVEIDQLKASRLMAVERLSEEFSEKEEHLSNAERKIAVLEKELGSLNENLVDEVELRTSLLMVEERLIKLSSEKEEMEKELRDISEHLLAAENNEQKIGLLNDQLEASLQIVEKQLAKELDAKEELQKNLEDITDQLIGAKNQVIELETTVLDLTNRLHDAEMARNEHLGTIVNLEHSLENTRSSWSMLIASSTAEIDRLKTSLKSVELEMAKGWAEKTELENSLRDAELKLSTCEKKVTDLETKTAAWNDTLLEKISYIRDLEARGVGQNEQFNRTSELEQAVNALSAELGETKVGWEESTKTSNTEINQLKASLKVAEEQLVNVEAEKAEYSSKLKASEAQYDVCFSRNRELQNSNDDLALSLHSTRENWVSLIESSKVEIDRLTSLCRSLSHQLSIESLKSNTSSRVLEDLSTKMAFAEQTINEKERHLSVMDAAIREKETEVLQLNSKYACLSNHFETLMMNCKESFRKHDQLLDRIEMKLASTSLEKDNLSNLLEEALGDLEGLKQRLIEKEDHLNSVLKEREDSLEELDNLEDVVSDLRTRLTVAQDNRKKLILEAKNHIDEINTSKKREEMKVMLEIVERKNVSSKLDAALAEMEELREDFQIDEDLIRDMKNSLSELKYSLNDEDTLNQKDSFADTDSIDARDDLMQVILYIKGKFDKLCEAERCLSRDLNEEKATNARLSYELHNALSSRGEIKNTQRRTSPLNDTVDSHENSPSSGNSDHLVKSASLQNHSVASRCSLGTEDEYEVTTYNATVHLEKSVLVSDLVPMERTMFGDNFDPLSMTINPELALTPHKEDRSNDSSDESEFSTPVAIKSWDVANLNSPRQIGTNEKTLVDKHNVSANVTKNLAHLAAIEENAELQEKMKNYEKDLLMLQAEAEESTSLHNQLTQKLVAIHKIVDDLLKAFYNRVPELPMEENLVNVSKDITALTQAIIESTGSTQNCFIDSVNMLVSDGSPSSHFIDSIAVTNSKIGAIAKDCFTLKKEMLHLSQLLVTELSSTSASISSSVEENLSCVRLEIAHKNADIEELQNTLLTSSLEKESIRDKLIDEVARNKELETKYNQLREECDDNTFQRNNILSIILELLRQWNGDEELVTEDAVKELKFAFGEAIHAKNIIKARGYKKYNFNFMKAIEEIVLNNELLEDSLTNLKSQLSKECKNLSAEVKIIHNENESLLLGFKACKNEIDGTLQRALEAINVLIEESQNLTSKEDVSNLKDKLKELHSLTEKVHELGESNSSLVIANEALIKDVNDSEFKNKELAQMLEALKASNGTLALELATLQETVENCRCSSLTEKVKVLEESNSSLSTANEALTKDVRDSEFKNKELAEMLEALKASKGSLALEMATLQETIASCSCSSLTAKVKILEENNSSLTTANEALTKDVRDSEFKNKELAEMLEALKASKGSLALEMATLQETIASCSSLTAKVKILEENNSSLTTANEALTKEVRDAEFKNKELAEMLEALKASKGSLALEIAALQETMASCSCSSLTAKVKILEENNSSLTTANQALTKDVSNSEFKNKELIDKLEELKASNGILSSDMAKLKETVLELSEKLSANELQLSVVEKEKLHVSGECSQCKQRESQLETIRKSVASVLASTIGKPIDLSSSRDDVVEKLNYTKDVLSRCNDTLRSVMELLDSQEMSGVIALEFLYRLLKTSDVREVYRCKKKIAEEICGMESELRVEELVQLSLLELVSKFVSVIMEKEAVVISNIRNKLSEDYDSKLASKDHQLCQYEDREKYLNEEIEDLTKENEKLEEALSSLRSQKVTPTSITVNSKCKETSISPLVHSFINQEGNKLLNEEIDSLNTQISSLKDGAAESTNKFKSWVSDLEKILTNFSESLSFERSHSSSPTNGFELEIKDIGFPNQLAVVLHSMYSNLGDMRKLYVSISNKSRENLLAGEHLNTRLEEVEKEHAMCKETKFKLEELQKELSTKDVTLSKLKADYGNLETKLDDLKKSSLSKDDEIVASLVAEKAGLELELQQSKKYIDELKSIQSAGKVKLQYLNTTLATFSSQVVSIKGDLRTYQEEAVSDNKKTLSYFQNLIKQILGLVEDENKKVRSFETEVGHLRGQLSILLEEKAKLASDIRNLEISLANESAEKRSLSERLNKLGNAPEIGHDDKSCPYKEKVQEYKKELWIIRQKSEDEQKKFDVMKNNIEEDLAFKSNIIKKLEERNETALSQFNLRLASSTTTYNQVCKKLEEAEERISLLRDMNSQDKKRFEKEIDNRNKEITRLQSVKTFVEELGIDCDKLEEALPEFKKKLSEFENLQATLNEMLEKNKELDEECDFMNKQIEFLETRNAEMFKKIMEMEENEEKLNKELADNRKLIDRSKRLQEEMDSMKVSVSQYIQALDASELLMKQTLKKLSEAESKNNQLQNAYKVLEANLESRNQKILHYVSEMKNYEKMLTEKTKMNQEVRLALEEERSKYEDLALQKSSKEKDLIALQKELGECQARLKDLGSRLEIAANLEATLDKVSTERDEALRSYNELKSKFPIAQQMIRSKDSLVISLRSSYEKLEADKKENEDILKARGKELESQIQVLKTEASDKAVRIAQLQSLIESSQTSPLESYKNKISSLENEVDTLKKELSRNFVQSSPRLVTVDAASLSNQPDAVTHKNHESAIHRFEKRETVLKRLCKQRRERILIYEELLRQNNIPIPISAHHSH